MPGRDKTGPNGEGPLTGRGLGPCGDGRPRGGGRGLYRGQGYGVGRRLDTKKNQTEPERN